MTQSPAQLQTPPQPEEADGQPKILVRDFCAAFAGKDVLRKINLEILPRERLAVIGPASGGKTTFLRCLNRLNDLEHHFSRRGQILLDGQDIYDDDLDVASLRRRVGMVYAVPIPLPWSLYDNLAYGPRLAGVRKRSDLDRIVETSLQSAFLWDEVKDRLRELASNLSGGQQQRLCLARVCHRQLVMSGLRQIEVSACGGRIKADERRLDRDESTGTRSA